MEKGTRWIYAGTVAWQDEKNQVHRRQLQWQSEVLDSATRGQYRIALLHGYPSDLTWYGEQTKRGYYILVAHGNRKLYLSDRVTPETKLPLSYSALRHVCYNGNLIFKLPLRDGEIFGFGADRGQRDGTFYVWMVDSIRPPEYVLIYRTLPDHQIVTYIPGIGSTHKCTATTGLFPKSM